MPPPKRAPKPRAVAEPEIPKVGPIERAILDALDHWTELGRGDYELAQEAGIDRSVITRFRDGSRSLKLQSIEALARPLNLVLHRLDAPPAKVKKRPR